MPFLNAGTWFIPRDGRLLVIYRDGLPVCRQSPIKLMTSWPDQESQSNSDTLPLRHRAIRTSTWTSAQNNADNSTCRPSTIAAHMCVAWQCNDRVSDFRSNGHVFDSRLWHFEVVTDWTGDCMRTGKTSWYHQTPRST